VKTLGPIILLLMAILSLYLGMAAKTFHAGGPGRNTSAKPLPKWFGRLWFFGFAAIMLYLGIKGLH
jgi:hypothetical protein